MPAKKKGGGGFEDTAKADKASYEREMNTYITKKKFKDPNVPKRPPLAFFLFCSENHPQTKGEHAGLFIGDVETGRDSEQHCCRGQAALRKEGCQAEGEARKGYCCFQS
ncbi:hypothetical protein I79_017547 [Cricetulus griseus]|uniref:HMGB1 n=1 Tax=Cricetulus griseus TaxID=10029 RepID=G3I2B8_CRIGR|nr:hypothetical protein I79_017547 [Cricetulus griseus]